MGRGKTDVIISFDSEDYLTPEAADAEMWWADALRARGIRGCFQVVGEFARSLVRAGRNDVIESLAAHEINFHTDFHSRPPTHPEALEGKSLAEGVEYVLRTEARGLEAVAATFGQWPVSYCSPGDSWTPATLLAMARMGLKVFCNDKLHGFRGAPYWYCGLLVSLYNLDFQTFYEPGAYADGAFERAFDALLGDTGEDGVIVLFTHPTRLVTARFWDEIFFGGARVPIENAPPAPLRESAEIERIRERCCGWLDWLVARDDLRFIDFATFYAERASGRRDLPALLAENGLAPGGEGRLPLRESGAESFMPSSVFDAVSYTWPPYPRGFTGASLLDQARKLSWTAAPAVKTPSASEPAHA